MLKSHCYVKVYLFFVLSFSLSKGFSQVEYSFDGKLEFQCLDKIEIEKESGKITIDFINDSIVIAKIKSINQDELELSYKIMDDQLILMTDHKKNNLSQFVQKSLVFHEQIALIGSKIKRENLKSKIDLNTGYQRSFENFQTPGLGIKIFGVANHDYSPIKSEYFSHCKVDLLQQIKSLKTFSAGYLVTSVCNKETNETWEFKRVK